MKMRNVAFVTNWSNKIEITEIYIYIIEINKTKMIHGNGHNTFETTA